MIISCKPRKKNKFANYCGLPVILCPFYWSMMTLTTLIFTNFLVLLIGGDGLEILSHFGQTKRAQTEQLSFDLLEEVPKFLLRLFSRHISDALFLSKRRLCQMHPMEIIAFNMHRTIFLYVQNLLFGRPVQPGRSCLPATLLGLR